jgi:hypothetical protein
MWYVYDGAANGETVMSSVITNNSQVQPQNNSTVVSNVSSHTQNSTNAHVSLLAPAPPGFRNFIFAFCFQVSQNSSTVSQKFNEQHVQNSSISPELNNSSRTSPLINADVSHIQQLMNGPTTENKVRTRRVR